MFLEFKHGGEVLAAGTAGPSAPQAAALAASMPPGAVTPAQTGEDFDPNKMTPFRYLIEQVGDADLLPVGQATVEALDALGNAIIEQAPPDTNPDSNIPPVYTYWSQFIDHELTARTDRNTDVSDIRAQAADLKPVDRHKVEHDLLNRRVPTIELDAVYGDGPPGPHGDKARHAAGGNLHLARKLRDGAKMRVGTNEVTNGQNGQPAGPVPPPATDLNRDLPRIGALLDLGLVREDDFPPDLRNSLTFRQRAFIGDPRNDENLIVAQFHVALLRFHNAVVDWLRFKDPRQEERDQAELFEDARKIVRWTFQWLVVNDFLKTLLRSDVVDKVLKDKAKLYQERFKKVKEVFMPVEFSVACYRFGHSMVRNGYDHNRNFGRQPDDSRGFILPFAPLNLEFLFTGKSPTPFAQGPGKQKTLPHNWIIEWDRFDGSSPHGQTPDPSNPPDPNKPPVPARVARKIDTHLAPTLGVMPNEGNDEANPSFKELLKHLARRNLRRGYQLSLPTGQALARAVGAQPLTHDELGRNNTPEVDQALGQGGFLDRTPLWFYVLKEAEVREDGQHLGELGSRIVAETVIGVLLNDPESYLAKEPSWDPSKKTPGSGGPLKLSDGRTIEKIGDLLEFAGVKPPAA